MPVTIPNGNTLGMQPGTFLDWNTWNNQQKFGGGSGTYQDYLNQVSQNQKQSADYWAANPTPNPFPISGDTNRITAPIIPTTPAAPSNPVTPPTSTAPITAPNPVTAPTQPANPVTIPNSHNPTIEPGSFAQWVATYLAQGLIPPSNFTDTGNSGAYNPSAPTNPIVPPNATAPITAPNPASPTQPANPVTGPVAQDPMAGLNDLLSSLSGGSQGETNPFLTGNFGNANTPFGQVSGQNNDPFAQYKGDVFAAGQGQL